MQFPERFQSLPDYAFPRLRKLLDSHKPGAEPIAMTIGEPRHPMPDFVSGVLAENIAGFGVYPPNDGTPELLAAISGWIGRRYGVTLAEDRLMVLNGTREGLFNAAVALCPEAKGGRRPVVLMPNPFYQVYAVAALTVGAEPVYVPATAATGHLPDYAGLPAELLDRVTVAYICSPANPQGAVASRDYWKTLLALAEKHDFQIFADECYSEIWRSAPPPRHSGGRGRGGRRSGTRGGLPFAVETVEPAGAAVGLCGRRSAKHVAPSQAARLCRGAPAPAAAARGRGRLE